MTTNPPPSPTPHDERPAYLWQLSRSHVDYVLHYSHWIPISRGFTQRMMAEHYPGWSYGQLIRLFDVAGIRILPDDNEGAHGAPHGGRCHWQVVSFSFSSPEDYFVEWDRTLPFDDQFTAQILTGGPGAPGGTGPLGGKIVKAVAASRPVDLSGKIFFD